MTSFAIDHHLSQCATAGGCFAVLAIDHRDNLVSDMTEARGRPAKARDVIAFKTAAVRHLAGTSSAVLVDPGYGFPAVVDSGVPARFGLLAPLEVTDYTLHPSRRPTVFIEDWGVEKIVRSGCSGVKLLLYYHPDAENAASQTELVDRVATACRAHDIPFFLEPIAYSLDPDEKLVGADLSRVVIETARHFSARGVDVLKMPFPLEPSSDESAWDGVLQELDDACSVPWALLSAGVSFELFLRQTEAACRAGASGVMVGRAVWAEGVGFEGEDLDEFMRTTALSRMQQLAAVCERHGAPWHAKTPRPKLDENWYR